MLFWTLLGPKTAIWAKRLEPLELDQPMYHNTSEGASCGHFLAVALVGCLCCVVLRPLAGVINPWCSCGATGTRGGCLVDKLDRQPTLGSRHVRTPTSGSSARRPRRWMPWPPFGLAT